MTTEVFSLIINSMINQPSTPQKGFIIPVVAAIVLILVLAAGGFYYYLSQKTGDANPFTALQKTTAGYALNPNCDYKDPDLCKFLNNWKTESNYTMTMTSTGGDSGNSTTTFQVDGQDKTHSKILAESPLDQSKQTYETITIGNTTYTKDSSDNKWWKQTNTSTQAETADNFKFTVPSATASAEERTTFEKVGKEACGKLTCFKYHTMTAGDTGMGYLWFDDTQYLLRKMELDSMDGTKTVIEYNYNKVAITEPSPVKEAKPDQMIMPNGSTMDSGLTQEQMDAMHKMMEEMSH